MLLNVKKLMKRGHDIALREWRNIERHKRDILNRFQKTQGSYNSRLEKKYSRLYEDYWIPVGRAKRFHLFNDIRVRYIRNVFHQDEKLDRLTANERFCGLEVLVIGCSGGILTESLAEMNFTVTGIDPNPFFLVIAKDHQERNKSLFGKKLNYVKATVEEFSKTNTGKFDVIVISNVLEFDVDFWHKQNFLKSCINCCKPGGTVLVTTMTSSLRTFFWTMLFDSEAMWSAVNHRWYRGTNPGTLKDLLESMNCRIMELRGIRFLPEDLKFIPDAEIRTWYFLHAKNKAPSQTM